MDGWGEVEGLKCAVAADLSLTEGQGVGQADAERAREGLRCAAAADLSRRLGFLVILVPFILHLRVVVIQIHANPLRWGDGVGLGGSGWCGMERRGEAGGGGWGGIGWVRVGWDAVWWSWVGVG